MIRKSERDLTSKIENRRKMRTIAHRIRKKRKKKEHDNDSSSEESDQLHQNIPKRFKGVIVPKPSGL